MNYGEAKKLTGKNFDGHMGRLHMDNKGACSNFHAAETSGFAPCTHRSKKLGYEYAAVRTSSKGDYAYYSLWARKGGE